MSRNNAVEVLHNSAFDRAKCAVRPKNIVNKRLNPYTKPTHNYVFVQKGFRPIVLKTFPNPVFDEKTAANLDNDVLDILTASSSDPITLNAQTYTDIVVPNIRRIGNMRG